MMKVDWAIQAYSEKILAANSEPERASIIKELHYKTRNHPRKDHIKECVETTVNNDGLMRIINKDKRL
jgi:hypothetical protein